MWNLNVEPTLVKKMVGCSRSDFSNIGSGGSTQSISITKMAEITQLSVRHTVGTGGFTLKIYSDAAVTDEIFSIESTDARVDIAKLGVMYQNTDSPAANLAYIKIIPDADNGHTFAVTLFYDKL